jgi:DNA adenine methylase
MQESEKIVGDLRYFMRNDLDIADIYRIFRAEGFLKKQPVPAPTGEAYSVVWMKGGWWVDGIDLFLRTHYGIPLDVAKKMQAFVSAFLVHQYKCRGWVPPKYPKNTDENNAQLPDPDEKELILGTIERTRGMLMSAIIQWSHKTKTTAQENAERIDSYVRWMLRHDYDVDDHVCALFKIGERRKKNYQERGLTKEERTNQLTKASNPVVDRYLAQAPRLPIWVTELVHVIKAKPKPMPLDLEQGSNMLPMFKWVGGKRDEVNMIHRILSMLEIYPDSIIEPFCGAAAMSLGLGIKNVVINDRNPGLINYYRYVRTGQPLDTSYPVSYNHYMGIRSAYNRLQSSIMAMLSTGQPISPEIQRKWASMFRYLIEYGFNGIWRINKAGGVNQTPGSSKVDPISVCEYPARYEQFASIAKGWTITNKNFDKVPVGGKNTLLYLDPPYDEQYSGYNNIFSEDDQEKVFQYMETHDGPIICHNACTPRIMCLAAKYKYSIFLYEGRTSVIIFKNLRFFDENM